MSQVSGAKGYAKRIDQFVETTEAIDFYELHKPFLDFIPAKPSRVLDVGAGAGRDAAVLASVGHNVVAVEPVPDFLSIARERHNSPNIEWVNDALPMLSKLGDKPSQFHFVLASAVWHHIDDSEREVAMMRISALLHPGGIFALSLRHGPAGAGSHIFPTHSGRTAEIARTAGLRTELILPDQPSVIAGKDDVRWTKLVFQRMQEPTD